MAASQSTPPLDTWHIQPSIRMSTWIDTWHVQPSIRTTMGLACDAHPYPDVLFGLNASVSNKSFDHVSKSIIIHFTKSNLDRTVLGHFKRPATTCHALPVEWKDNDDDKSSLQQSLTAAYRVMIALPPSKHHHDSQKVFQGTMLLEL